MSLQYMMTQPVLDEINREVASLSKDEQLLLAQTEEYKKAKESLEKEAADLEKTIDKAGETAVKAEKADLSEKEKSSEA